jgi:hypothetical protein
MKNLSIILTILVITLSCTKEKFTPTKEVIAVTEVSEKCPPLNENLFLGHWKYSDIKYPNQSWQNFIDAGFGEADIKITSDSMFVMSGILKSSWCNLGCSMFTTSANDNEIYTVTRLDSDTMEFVKTSNYQSGTPSGTTWKLYRLYISPTAPLPTE